MQKTVSFCSTKCEKCSKFFDKMRKVCHFFLKMQKVFQFFDVMCKTIRSFLLVNQVLSNFPDMCAKTDQVFQTICEFVPRKEEFVDWMSQISRGRSIGVVHSHALSSFLHHLHFSKLVLCHGYCVI